MTATQPADDHRTAVVVGEVTPAERDAVLAEADLRGITPGELVRRAVLAVVRHGPVVRRHHSEQVAVDDTVFDRTRDATDREEGTDA